MDPLYAHRRLRASWPPRIIAPLVRAPTSLCTSTCSPSSVADSWGTVAVGRAAAGAPAGVPPQSHWLMPSPHQGGRRGHRVSAPVVYAQLPSPRVGWRAQHAVKTAAAVLLCTARPRVAPRCSEFEFELRCPAWWRCAVSCKQGHLTAAATYPTGSQQVRPGRATWVVGACVGG